MGTRIDPHVIEDPCIICGCESDIGCHGINEGEVESLHYCNKHYNIMKYEPKAAAVRKTAETKKKKVLEDRKKQSKQSKQLEYAVEVK